MTRSRILTILLPVVLSACLPMPSQQALKPPGSDTNEQDRELLIAGIDQFDTSRRSEAFLKLQQDHPNSPWNRRAKVLTRLAGTIRILDKKVKRQQALIDVQQDDQQTLTDLRQENASLHEQINALKFLIVDLELRQP